MTRVQECLAKNIKRYRKMRMMSQERLAEVVETSTNYIGVIEIGKKFPSPQMIERIAAALGVDSPLLFCADSEPLVIKPDADSLKKLLMKNLESAVDESLEKL